jgi:hypothetical protein
VDKVDIEEGMRKSQGEEPCTQKVQKKQQGGLNDQTTKRPKKRKQTKDMNLPKQAPKTSRKRKPRDKYQRGTKGKYQESEIIETNTTIKQEEPEEPEKISKPEYTHEMPELKATFDNQRIGWEKAMNRQAKYMIPRINFTHQNKVKRGLKTIYAECADILERFQDLKLSKEEWNFMIKYCFSKITEFVGRTIGVRIEGNGTHATPKQNKKLNKEEEEKAKQMTAKEFADIRNEFDKEETTIGQIENIMNEYEAILHEENVDRVKAVKLNQLFELKNKLTITSIDINTTNRNTFETQLTGIDWHQWAIEANKNREVKLRDRLNKKMDFVHKKLQDDFAFDSKRTIRRLINDSSPICEIEPDILEEF